MKTFLPDGSAYVEELIKAAIEDGSRIATVSGCHEIDRAIAIPSDFTLILDDCHLRLADGCYSNIFINEHHGTEIGKTAAGTDRNIKLVGRGLAILDGGNYNGLSEKNHSRDGLPPIWKNNTLLFTNVDNFEVGGIAFHHQRWWALNFIYCTNGYIHDIHSKACDLAVDEDGTMYNGLKRARYSQVYVKNADCVDIRCGCHDILIENITGFTEDDTVAMTGLCGGMEDFFAVEGACPDIYNITVKNVRSAAYCTNVRMLNQGEIKLHDILVDGVYDTSAECDYLDRGTYAVRIGDTRMYGSRHATEDETYNITVRNVRSRGDYAITLAGAMKNVTIENVECFDGAQPMLDKRGEA